MNALHYLKYFLFHAIGALSIVVLLSGGATVTVGLFAIVAFYVIGDAVAGNDQSSPGFKRPRILTAQLWAALPLLCLIVYSSVWTICAGDPLRFGGRLTALTGYDLTIASPSGAVLRHVVGSVSAGGTSIRPTWSPGSSAAVAASTS